MTEIIDAHHHLWHYSEAEYDWIDQPMKRLQRDFTPADLMHEITGSGIHGTVAVQARQTLAETEWLLACAEESPAILGVVGWLPLSSAELPDVLRSFRNRTKLKGVRHVVQGEPDGFLRGDDFNRGIAALLDTGLAYDLLIHERHLPEAAAFVRRHPQQRFVVDHLAKPRIRAREMEPWRTNLMQLADCANVCCKVSGVVTEADWKTWQIADIEPYLDVALEAFGAERLMAGSDWPVCLVASTYRQWWSTLSAWARRLTPGEQENFFAGNTRSFYRLA